MPIFPRGPGDQLDQRLAVDVLRVLAQRKGKARAGRTHAPRRIGLPQPVGLAFLEFAQQQRDHFAFLGHPRLGHFAREERPCRLKTPDSEEDHERHGGSGCGKLAVADEHHDAGKAKDRVEDHRAQRHCGKGQRGSRHQHCHDRPHQQALFARSIRREQHDRDNPDGPGRHSAKGLLVDFGLRHPPAIGILKASIEARGMEHHAGKKPGPAEQDEDADSASERLHHQQRRQRMGCKPRADQPGEARILQPAQAPPIPFVRIGQPQHGHGRKFLRQGGQALFGGLGHACGDSRETLRNGKRSEILAEKLASKF